MTMTRKQFFQSAAALAAASLFACNVDVKGSGTSGGSNGEGDDGGGGGSPPSGNDAGDGNAKDGGGEIDAGGDGGGEAGGDAGGDGGGGDPRCLDNGTNVAIGNNHGHTLVVSKQDVADAADKTYSIQGDAVHSHNVTLTAAHFAQLAQNQSVTVVSTTDSAHSHTVTVTCV